MPLYKVRPGYRHGARNQYGPGDIVEITNLDAQGFLDKLEPAPDDPEPEAGETSQSPVSPLDENLTRELRDWLKGSNLYQLRDWLKTNPSTPQARDALDFEKAGQNRKGAIDALEAYINEEVTDD